MARGKGKMTVVVSEETMAGDTPLEKRLNAYLTRQYIMSHDMPDDECLRDARTVIQMVNNAGVAVGPNDPFAGLPPSECPQHGNVPLRIVDDEPGVKNVLYRIRYALKQLPDVEGSNARARIILLLVELEKDVMRFLKA